MNEIEELFPFYALGVLSFEEKAQVEAYVAQDAAAKTRLEEMIATARALPFEAIPTPPSESVKTTLMARVRADAVNRQRSIERVTPPAPNWVHILRNWLGSPAFSTATLAALVILGIWVANLQSHVTRLTSENRALQETVVTLSSENETLQTNLIHLQQENNLLQNEILSDEELIALLTNPTRQEIPVAGTEHQPEAQGTLLVGTTEGKRAVLIVSDLPALPSGMTYQFWLIGDGIPIGAGLFQSNSQGQGVLVVNSEETPIMSFDAIGVSIEPEGGSEQPTGNIVLLGNLPGGS